MNKLLYLGVNYAYNKTHREAQRSPQRRVKIMSTLTVLSLKAYFSDNFESEFHVMAGQILDRALNCSFDSKAELSDWVNSLLDSDNFDVSSDVFTDDVNDIINVVAESQGIE